MSFFRYYAPRIARFGQGYLHIWLPASIYYRSDSRPPKEIFRYGFEPRDIPSLTHALGARCLSSRSEQHNFDTCSRFGVSVSTRFESAALFPLIKQDKQDNTTSYVYIIAGPKSIKLSRDQHLGIRPADQYPKISWELHDQIYDIHSLQVEQAQAILEKYPQNIKAATWPLYAYEALAMQILAHRIIAAVKIIQGPIKKHDCELSFLERTFSIKEIIKNPNFNPCFEAYSTVYTKNNSEAEISGEQLTTYTTEKQDIKSLLFYWNSILEQKHEISTTPPLWGVGDKILPSPAV